MASEKRFISLLIALPPQSEMLRLIKQTKNENTRRCSSKLNTLEKFLFLQGKGRRGELHETLDISVVAWYCTVFSIHISCSKTPVPRQMSWALLSAWTKLGRNVADAAESPHCLVQNIALKLYLLEMLLVLHFLVTVPFLNPLHTKKALGRGTLCCLCRYTELKACHNDEAHDLQPGMATCLSSQCQHG